MLQAGRSWVQFVVRSLYFFNLPNPSSRTMTLGSTQPLTEMSTRNLPGRVNGGQGMNLRSLLPSVSRLSRKCWSLNVPQPCGPPWPVTVIGLHFFFLFNFTGGSHTDRSTFAGGQALMASGTCCPPFRLPLQCILL
jgi:hypothetical protein